MNGLLTIHAIPVLTFKFVPIFRNKEKSESRGVRGEINREEFNIDSH